MSKYKGDKPKYEAPAVMALGELASAVGQSCTGGTGPATGSCKPGTSGWSSCGVGVSPDEGAGECNCGDGPKLGGCSPGVGGDPQPVDNC